MTDTNILQPKTRNTADHFALHESVKKWFFLCRDRGVLVNGVILKEKERNFAKKFGG